MATLLKRAGATDPIDTALLKEPSMSSTPTTIDDISAELLLKIFDSYVAPRQGVGHYHTINADQRHRRPVVLTHVCRDWRALSLADPGLWTDIRLTGTAKLDLLFFERSRPLPIDLTIELDAMGRSRNGAGCAAIIGCRLLAQPMQDRVRIRSIRSTHLHDYDAQSMISFIDRLNLPALSALLIKTTGTVPPPRRRREWGIGKPLQPQLLLEETLTTLEFHNRRQILDGSVVKRALESCPQLESLIVGGLLIEETPPDDGNRPYTLARSLKRLAVGSPIFRTPENHEKCNSRCPCPFRTLYAPNIEYLEVAGGEAGDTLLHLIPVINRRGAEIGVVPVEQAPLALVLNSSSISSPFDDDDEDLVRALPQNVNLHLLGGGFNVEHARDLHLCEWYGAARSVAVYVTGEATANDGRLGRRRAGYAPFRSFQRGRDSTAVLVQPDPQDCVHLSDADVAERGWILPPGEACGPYLDASQPSVEVRHYMMEGGYRYRVQRSQGRRYYIEDDLEFANFDWQEYRRGLGWPDNYDSPSD